MNKEASTNVTKVAKKRGRKPKKFPVCEFKEIIKPHKFINPYRFYRLNSYVVVGEEDRTIFSCLNVVNAGKSVTHVELNTPYNDVITVHLEDTHCVQTVPSQYLISRLKSYGDHESYEWAQMFERYDEDYKRDLSNLRNQPTVCEAMIQKDEDIRAFLMDKPCCWMNCKYTDNDLKLTSISFSDSLLKTLRYTWSRFLKVCFDEGVPSFFRPSEDSKRLFGKFVFKKLFFPNFSRSNGGNPCQIYDAFGSSVSVVTSRGSVCSLMEDGSVEAQHFLKFEVKENGQNDTWTQTQENPEYKNYIQDKSKLLIEFLKKSQSIYKKYGDKTIDEAKVCKIRDLSTEIGEDVCKKFHPSEENTESKVPNSENQTSSRSETM